MDKRAKRQEETDAPVVPERINNLKPLERIERVLKGEPVDRPAFCLYPCYDLELLGGEVLAQAIQVFVERTETDVVAVPACFGYTLDSNVSLDRPADLAKIVPVHGRHGAWSQQQDAIRTTCRAFFGKRPVVAVVPSPYLQLQKLAGARLTQEALRESSGFFGQAIDSLTKSLANFIKQAVEAGVQGIILEEPAASHEVMELSTYREKLLPSLLTLIETCKPAWSVVQFLGRRIYWEELKLPSQGLGWPVSAGPKLGRGAMRWPGFVWGGLDSDHYADASPAWLRGSLRNQMEEITTRPLILTTPGGLKGLSMDRIEALAFGLRRLPSAERLRETPAELEARRAATPPRPRKHKEEYERPAPVVREAPTPLPGARTRLHAKQSPEEPLSPPVPDL
ncbi:hypothetical protein ABS71_01385 [bacterium SCN 62-11]|nr:hypothetical protein [Candidatus Eremiobacteraeota bacterium]ODT78969.1 MAG: hypothetical protein ABS71_01385 [bacterium SCN 62-11]